MIFEARKNSYLHTLLTMYKKGAQPTSSRSCTFEVYAHMTHEQ